MASGDVIFETGGLKQDSFSAQDAVDTSSNQSVAIEFSFGTGTATFNGSSISVVDAVIKLKQALPNFQPPAKVESDSPFDSAKSYKIQIVEV